MKTDKDGVLTKEYIDYVKRLEREDLERFYIGADLYNYEISNDNKRLHNIINKAISYIKIFDEYIGYDDKLYLLKLLEDREDNEI